MLNTKIKNILTIIGILSAMLFFLPKINPTPVNAITCQPCCYANGSLNVCTGPGGCVQRGGCSYCQGNEFCASGYCCDNCEPCCGTCNDCTLSCPTNYSFTNSGCASQGVSCDKYDDCGVCGSRSGTCYLVNYTLSYTAGANGTLSGTTSQAICRGSNGSAVTANPNSGYAFSNWSDSSTANPRTDSNVTANISVTANFVQNNVAPTAPTSLLTEGGTNPVGVTDTTPEFSAIFNDPNTGDTGIYYEINVNTASNFAGTVMWNSGQTSMTATTIGARSPDISYAGTALSLNGTTYYWRIRFSDNYGAVGAWSATAQFTMNTAPTAPTSLLTKGATNPINVNDGTPEFSAIFNDPNTGDTGIYSEVEVNTNSSFTGTIMWDSGLVSMTSTAIGARSPDIIYAGTTLSLNGVTYYWRIRFADNYATVGAWSATAQFTMSASGKPPWVDSNWLYRQTIVVSNPGATLTNEDVLITIDSAALVAAGKLQNDCADFRFVDSDGTTYLQYWIEDGCNTASTKIWVRIPSLPAGGKTISMYYGYASATVGSLSWGGNIMLYADTTCPTGWTRASTLDGKFLMGSSTYGTTGGSSSHSHTDSCTSTSISTTNIGGLASGGNFGTTTSHTHTLSATVNDATSVLPPYENMIVCYNTHFTLSAGLISLFTATQSGWTRFSALDNIFPQANSTFGGTGGSSTHTHTTTDATTDTSGGTQTLNSPLSGSGGTVTTSGGYTIHTFTSSGTFTANQAGSVDILVVGGGGGAGYDRSGGGGGGGAIYQTNTSISSGSITVTVGNGGAVGNSSHPAGYNGGNSSFGSYLSVLGGGGGGGYGASAVVGGSGGGGNAVSGDGVGASGTAGQGYNGGNGNTGTPWSAGGGGGAGSAGGNFSGTYGGNGGSGKSCSITGIATYYGGGGGGRGDSGSSGGAGGGGGAGVAGTNGLGGGGGAYAAGGSGVVIIRYLSAGASTGTIATGTHTHTVTSSTMSTDSNIPSYQTMLLGKANSTTYVNETNIIMTSELQPLGWNRYTALDNRFVMGSATSGTTGGASTHTHTSTLTTGGPSATISSYSSGSSFADTTHTHSCTATTSSASNNPPYSTVIYSQRKTSQSSTINPEDSENTPPNAPTGLYTESLTNPVGITNITPAFSAVFSDFDTADTGNYYQIQVNTASDFTGTSMWDSTKIALSPTVTNGARSQDITYAGTTLALNGATYYWRIKFWDNHTVANESAWSATAQFTMNTAPSAPTNLLTEGSTNPVGVTAITPKFSAIFNDSDTSDTGNYYQIQVNTNSSFTGTIMWDSNKTASSPTIARGARSQDISYAGTTLTLNGVTYYWRIKFWDNKDSESAWSSTAQFTMDTAPTAPTNLLTEGTSNPIKVATLTPKFSAIFNDPDSVDTGTYYQIQVNTASDFTGTIMWDSTQTALSPAVAKGARSQDISYAGTALTLNGTIYYWKIKFWDTSGVEGAWSAVANFRMSGNPDNPTDLLTDGKTDPLIISSTTPKFSAIYSDPNADNASAYQIQVNTNPALTGTVMWDTGKTATTITSGSRSPDYTYAGTALVNTDIMYYWRIRFWDADGNVSNWSSVALFSSLQNSFRIEGIKMEGIKIN